MEKRKKTMIIRDIAIFFVIFFIIFGYPIGYTVHYGYNKIVLQKMSDRYISDKYGSDFDYDFQKFAFSTSNKYGIRFDFWNWHKHAYVNYTANGRDFEVSVRRGSASDNYECADMAKVFIEERLPQLLDKMGEYRFTYKEFTANDYEVAGYFTEKFDGDLRAIKYDANKIVRGSDIIVVVDSLSKAEELAESVKHFREQQELHFTSDVYFATKHCVERYDKDEKANVTLNTPGVFLTMESFSIVPRYRPYITLADGIDMLNSYKKNVDGKNQDIPISSDAIKFVPIELPITTEGKTYRITFSDEFKDRIGGNSIDATFQFDRKLAGVSNNFTLKSYYGPTVYATVKLEANTYYVAKEETTYSMKIHDGMIVGFSS